MKASGNVRILVRVLKFTMADPAEEVPAAVEDEEPEETPGYKPPAQKSVDEIQQLDADDESLVRYKQALLGDLPAGKLKVISSHCPIHIFLLILASRPHVRIFISYFQVLILVAPTCRF